MKAKVAPELVEQAFWGLIALGLSESYAKQHAEDFAEAKTGLVSRVILERQDKEKLVNKINRLEVYMKALGYGRPREMAVEIYQDMYRQRNEVGTWDVGLGAALVLSDVLSTEDEMLEWIENQLENKLRLPETEDTDYTAKMRDWDLSEQLAQAILKFDLDSHFAPTYLHVPYLMRYQYSDQVQEILKVEDFVVFAKSLLAYDQTALPKLNEIVRSIWGASIASWQDAEAQYGTLGNLIGQLLFAAHSNYEQAVFSD